MFEGNRGDSCESGDEAALTACCPDQDSGTGDGGSRLASARGASTDQGADFSVADDGSITFCACGPEAAEPAERQDTPEAQKRRDLSYRVMDALTGQLQEDITKSTTEKNPDMKKYLETGLPDNVKGVQALIKQYEDSKDPQVLDQLYPALKQYVERKTEALVGVIQSMETDRARRGEGPLAALPPGAPFKMDNGKVQLQLDLPKTADAMRANDQSLSRLCSVADWSFRAERQLLAVPKPRQ